MLSLKCDLMFYLRNPFEERSFLTSLKFAMFFKPRFDLAYAIFCHALVLNDGQQFKGSEKFIDVPCDLRACADFISKIGDEFMQLIRFDTGFSFGDIYNLIKGHISSLFYHHLLYSRSFSMSIRIR